MDTTCPECRGTGTVLARSSHPPVYTLRCAACGHAWTRERVA